MVAFRTRLSFLAVALVLVISFGFPASAEIVRADGSSTVFPISEAMAEEFQYAKRGRRVTVGVSGTGGGFRKFCRGDTQVSNASRTIRQQEIDACRENGVEFVEIPVALDAIAVVVNESNDWLDSITIDELRKIWEPAAQGKINNWQQVNPDYPNKRLTLFGPGTDSGTYDYFTAAVVGKEHSSRGDYTASEDDNIIVSGVAGDKGALGFFGLAYYDENKNRLKALGISHKGGLPVLPSVETAKSGLYEPLSRPVFIYVNRKVLAEREDVRDFVRFHLDPEMAPELVAEVGYVPFSKAAYRLLLDRVEKAPVGTEYTSENKHLPVEEIFGLSE